MGRIFCIDTPPLWVDVFSMENLIILSAVEQVARHLRKELLRGNLSGTMPGVNPLAEELGVNHKTVRAALRQLEGEGLLVDQGRGLQRRIVLPENHDPPALRVAILSYDPDTEKKDYLIELRHTLVEAGHIACFTSKTLLELNMKVPRIQGLVEETEADAWVVVSASHEVLDWFSKQQFPAFALFGRRRSVRIAGVGPDHETADRVAVQRLLALGHRRIALLVRESQRATGPGKAIHAIFEEMDAHGLPTGPYNLPEWEDNPEDFYRMLDELFRVTPPTALIIDEPFLFHAAKDHLARRGILAPEQVSLICADADPTFAWSQPSIAHLNWDIRPVVHRVVGWVNDVAHGKENRQQTLTRLEFVDGGTVGPLNGEF
jgi:DNA-binding transcriptional regulator YhcF (GntR family)